VSRTAAPASARQAEGNLNRLAGGITLLFSGGWVAYLLSLAFNVAVARHLGPQAFGAFTVGLTTSILLTRIAPVGMNLAVTRYVAIYHGQGDPRRIRGVVRLALAVTLAGGTAVGGAVFLLAGPLATGVFHAPELAGVLRVFALTIPIGATSDTLLAAVRGCSHVASTVTIRSFASPGLRMLAALAALAVASSATGVAVSYTVAEGVSLLLALAAARRVLPGPAAGRPIRPDGEVFRFAWPLALNHLVNASSSKAEVFLLGALDKVGSVSLFAAAQRFTVVAEAVMGAVGLAFSPMASDLYAHDQREHLARLYKAASRWMFMIGVPVFLTQVLFGRLLLGAFGDAFEAAERTMVVLACGQLVYYTTGTAFHMLVMTGRSRLAFANSLAYVVVSLGLNVALIPRFGLMGAAVANSAAVVAYGLVVVAQVHRVTGMHPWSPSFVKPAAAGLAAALGSGWLAGLLPLGPGRLHDLAHLGILLALYPGVLAALRLHPDDRMVVGAVTARVRRRQPAAPGPAAPGPAQHGSP